jgi:hypothetical protein
VTEFETTTYKLNLSVLTNGYEDVGSQITVMLSVIKDTNGTKPARNLVSQLAIFVYIFKKLLYEFLWFQSIEYHESKDFALSVKILDPVFKHELQLYLGELLKRYQYGLGILNKAISGVKTATSRDKRQASKMIGKAVAKIVNFGLTVYPDLQPVIDDGFESLVDNLGR